MYNGKSDLEMDVKKSTRNQPIFHGKLHQLRPSLLSRAAMTSGDAKLGGEPNFFWRNVGDLTRYYQEIVPENLQDSVIIIIMIY